MLFHEVITDLKSWGRVFQDPALFTPLARAVFEQAGRPFPGLECCLPGSNAVFRAGDAVLKIFAPEETGIGGAEEFLAERYGLERAAALGVPAPRMLAYGLLRDRYAFRWLLLERVEGFPLSCGTEKLSPEDWRGIGGQLRRAVEQLDGPCPPFRERTLRGPSAEERWTPFPASFRAQREVCLARAGTGDVFVHGDLNGDNLLVGPDGRLVLIDFADARTAPFETELAALVCDGFRFPPDYLLGFLGAFDREELADQLTLGLLLHDYGAWIIRDRVGAPETFAAPEDLKRALMEKLPRKPG